MSQIDKALSVRQPWAWCIVNGWKPIENRSRPTKFKGRLLIHASLKFDEAGYQWIKDSFPILPLPARDEFQLGGIVGEVIVDGVVDEPFIEALRRAGTRTDWTRWFMGPFGYVLSGARVLPFRPYKGMLGFFTVKPEETL